MPSKKAKKKVRKSSSEQTVTRKKKTKKKARTKKRHKVHVEFTEARKRKFLERLRSHGVITYAADEIGITTSTVSKHRAKDSDFDEQCAEAIDVAVSELEVVARQRAVEGVRQPVYQGGFLVGYKIVHSDRLMEKLLEAHLPQKYSDRLRTPNEDTGPSISITLEPSE